MKTSPIDEVRDESYRNLSSLILRWRRPGEVRVEGDSLVYSARSVSTYLNPDEPFEVLKSFIDLEGAASDKIVRFAQRWGVLGICEHGLPSIHNPGIHTFVDSPGWKLIQRYEYRDSCFSTRRSDGLYFEPLDEWSYWVQQASIIVRLGAELHALRPGSPKDWQTMGYEPKWFRGFIGRGDKIPSMPPPISLGRVLLAQYINDWLTITGVQPMFFWEQGKHAFYLGSWGIDRLLAVLGVQMLLLINRSSGYALCSNCGRPFFLRHRQSSARNVYCDSPGCGLKAAKRAAQKRYSLRERHNPSRDRRPKTRLTDKQVKIIRNKCNRYSGKYPAGFIKGLAEDYGVSVSLIYKIAEGAARTNVK